MSSSGLPGGGHPARPAPGKYPVTISRPPARVEGYRVLAWAELTRYEGHYPSGFVLCARAPGENPGYVIWLAYTKDGGETWTVPPLAATSTDDHQDAWQVFAGRCEQSDRAVA
jgi:hypothetical protein